ncbi:MAG: hypothetical protein WBP11_00920 [Dokdonella sp.]
MKYKMIYSLIAMSMLGICGPAFASEGGSDGFAAAQNLNYMHLPGPDQMMGVSAPTGSLGRYRFVAGSAFTPRRSDQTVIYLGAGCMYSNFAITTSLELPDSALINGVRLYYYSTSPTEDVRLYLTTYPGDGDFYDLLTGLSTTSSGYSSEYFSLTPAVTVDNFSTSTALTASMNPNTRFCGMRVFYTE